MKRMLALLLMMLLSCSLGAAVALPAVFASGMVLQREKPVPVYGTAAAGERVVVSFAGQRHECVADAAGKWQVTLSPLTLSAEPQKLLVRGQANECVLEDVLVGDVWFASGQSNMEMRVHSVFHAQEEMAKANYPLIRSFTVQRALSSTPQAEPRGVWQVCSPQTVGRFSAAAYFFAREIVQSTGVPVGIVNSSVGASAAECWVPADVLRSHDKMPQPLPGLKAEEYSDWQTYDEVRRQLRLQDSFQDQGISEEAKAWSKPEFDDAAWRLVTIPGTVKAYGLGKVDGVFWYRCEVDVPPEMTGKTAHLNLSFIYHQSTAFVNGQRLGHIACDGREWFNHRYTIPRGVLKAGKNAVVVRIVVEQGDGGFWPRYPYVRNIQVGEQKVLLPTQWRFQAEATRPAKAPSRHLPPGYKLPAALYNAMVHAYHKMPVRGFLWYQGESNAGRCAEHKTLFPLLIRTWRRLWGDDTLPFYFVQLPDYMKHSDNPNDRGGWAEFRWAQQDTHERVPHTGMAVTLGIGEAGDVHPRNKQECGRRLALWALRDVYGFKDLPVCGPLFAAATRQGQAVQLQFTHVYDGLKSGDGQPLRGFAVAGADKRFVWAQARMSEDGRSVVVEAPSIAQPRFVRYAWASNPEHNLVNSANLPAGSFTVELAADKP